MMKLLLNTSFLLAFTFCTASVASAKPHRHHKGMVHHRHHHIKHSHQTHIGKALKTPSVSLPVAAPAPTN
jgi:hypothetical protein